MVWRPQRANEKPEEARTALLFKENGDWAITYGLQDQRKTSHSTCGDSMKMGRDIREPEQKFVKWRMEVQTVHMLLSKRLSW